MIESIYMIPVGERAPDFALPDENGEQHKLSQYRGKWLLLYFYPCDDTPGCTKEACSLRDQALRYEANDVMVIGVSDNSTESHRKFVEKYKLPFTLLADTLRTVINTYGAGGHMGTNRMSYLIGPDQIIEKVYTDVHPEMHAEEVLRDIEPLK